MSEIRSNHDQPTVHLSENGHSHILMLISREPLKKLSAFDDPLRLGTLRNPCWFPPRREKEIDGNEVYAHSIEGRPVEEWHHEGTVPDLWTERSRVVESGLSPAERSDLLPLNYAAESGGIWWDYGMKLKLQQKD